MKKKSWLVRADEWLERNSKKALSILIAAAICCSILMWYDYEKTIKRYGIMREQIRTKDKSMSQELEKLIKKLHKKSRFDRHDAC